MFVFIILSQVFLNKGSGVPIGSATFFNAAFADTPPAGVTVTATCKDGTSFTGTTKKGACSGHKGVEDWADDKASAVTENKPAVTEKSPSAKTAKETTVAKPATASTTAQAELGLVLWKGKLMLLYQLVRRFHEIYAPSNFYRRIQERSRSLI